VSGTTLIACKVRRQARLSELEPTYCDVIIPRWQEFTGQEARLEPMGKATRGRRSEELMRCEAIAGRAEIAPSKRCCSAAIRTSSLCLALSDWSAELRILRGEKQNRRPDP